MVGVFGADLVLLRPGGVTRAQIEAVAGPLVESSREAGRSPGRLARHYAPSAPLILDVTEPAAGQAYLAFGPVPDGPGIWNLSPTGDLVEAAARLFACLRAADGVEPESIAVAPIPDQGLGEAINDRLRRAAGMVG